VRPADRTSLGGQIIEVKRRQQCEQRSLFKRLEKWASISPALLRLAQPETTSAPARAI
jgi:hypothetical protein